MKSNKVEVKEKIRIKCSSSLYSLFDVLSLKDGIFVKYANNVIKFINVYNNSILFEFDISESGDHSNNLFVISDDKKYIYLSFNKKIYSISTKNYKMKLLYEDKNDYFIYKMSSNNTIALVCDNLEEKQSSYLKILNVLSGKIIDIFYIKDGIETRNPIIFTEDDRYVILDLFDYFTIFSLKKREYEYNKKLNDCFIASNFRKDYKFSKNDKYLLAPFEILDYDSSSISESDCDSETVKVIDFHERKELYYLSEKMGYSFFSRNSNNLILSNDKNYAFVYIEDTYTIAFEISTGEILDIPKNYRLFFDINYPNNIGMLNKEEYILAEIKYKDLY